MTRILDNDLFIDFETRSLADLKAAGGRMYARHPSTEVLCLGWAIGGSMPAKTWVPFRESFPQEITDALASGCRVVAHHYAFDMEIWDACLRTPVIQPEQWRCTLAMAYASGLPGKLEELGEYFGGEKKASGKSMLYLSKPDKNGNFRENAAKFADMEAYCRQDVEVMRDIFGRMRDLSADELEVFLLDQKINRRGVRIDLPAVRNAEAQIAKAAEVYDEEMRILTNGNVTKCSQVERLKDWLIFRGVADIDALGKNDVPDVLGRDDLPVDVRKALELRALAGRSSTAKLGKMLSMADEDGFIRWGHQYHAATTGRWGGRGVQWQNFVRSSLKPAKQREIADKLHRGENIEDPMTSIPEAMRALIIAPEGQRLLVNDYSSVEARGVAWLAGQDDVLDVFRTGADIYKHAAGKIYGVAPESIAKDDIRRQVGKVSILACGYQGGYRSVLTFAAAYRLTISESEAQAIVSGWRAGNTKIVQYWKDVERAAVRAIEQPGVVQSAGPDGREVEYVKHGSDLLCKLPSGRILTYPKARLVDGLYGPQVSFWGQDSMSKKWRFETTYGGRLVENLTQAICRDILSAAMLRLEDAGYPVNMHVHDEVVCVGGKSLEEMAAIMTQVPAWAEGFPIAAAGFEGERYGKD